MIPNQYVLMLFPRCGGGLCFLMKISWCYLSIQHILFRGGDRFWFLMNISLMFFPIQHILQMSDTAKAMSFLTIRGRSMLKHWFPTGRDGDGKNRRRIGMLNVESNCRTSHGCWISAGEAKYDFLIASAQLHYSLMKSQFGLVKLPFLKSQTLF